MAEVTRGTHAEGVAAQVLLAGEALPAGLAGVRALPGVRADVALQDPLLLGRVGAERALVQLDGHHQHVTLGMKHTALARARSELLLLRLLAALSPLPMLGLPGTPSACAIAEFRQLLNQPDSCS